MPKNESLLPPIPRPLTALAQLVSLLALAACDTPPLVPGPANTGPELEAIQLTEGLFAPVALEGQPAGPWTLRERMEHHRVPGVSIAVIDGGELRWAKAWGQAVTAGGAGSASEAHSENGAGENGDGEPLSPETLFQAGSISKAVTATLVLRLADEDDVDLDAELDTVAVRGAAGDGKSAWHPDRPGVTLRRLLRHTAGIGVPSFEGYAGDGPLPSLPQILAGTSPASSPTIRVEHGPGERWIYSGGGYQVLEHWVERQGQRPFADLARQELFGPLDMPSTSFFADLPADLRARAAAGHDRDGQPLPGGGYRFPEKAAAGLWTTPTDLAQWIMDLQKAQAGKPARRLSRSRALEMIGARRTPTDIQPAGAAHWGSGVMVGGVGQARWFGHPGGNPGFAALALGFQSSGHGVVVMTNGEGGHALIREIVTGLAKIYDWPQFQQQGAQQLDEPAVSGGVPSAPPSGGAGIHTWTGTWISPSLPGHELVLKAERPAQKSPDSSAGIRWRAAFLGDESPAHAVASGGLLCPEQGWELRLPESPPGEPADEISSNATDNAPTEEAATEGAPRDHTPGANGGPPSRLELHLFPGYRFELEQAEAPTESGDGNRS